MSDPASPRPPGAKQAHWSWLGGGLLLAFLLIYLKPYHGIRHDAVLYLGQALLRWKPEQFSQDLFFLYGSQAEFTIFPQIIAWLMAWFSAAELFLAATLLGLCLFALASAVLVRRLLPEGQRFFALLALLVLPTGYGGWGIFSYAEPFFTGRTLGEPLILLAIAAWFGSRRVWAAGIWLLAAAIHPLQALPALVIAWLDLVHRDRRWLHLLWVGALSLPLVGVLGIIPADRLFASIDEQWLGWLKEPDKFLFLTLWRPADWMYALTDLFLGWLILQRAAGALQDFARAAIVATLAGFAASLLLADLLQLAMPTALQLWRAHWLLHWLAMACVPWLLIGEYATEGRFATRWWLLLTIVVFGTPAGGIAPSPLAVLLLIPMYLAWPTLQARIGTGLRRGLKLVIPMFPVLGLAKFTQGAFGLLADAGWARQVVRPEFVFLSYSLVAGAFAAGVVVLLRRGGSYPLVVVPILALALWHAAGEWDRRNEWTRYIESAQYKSNLFGVEIEPTAQVYWKGELLAPWLVLQRASYFNDHQLAGQIFNRKKAEEANARRRVLRVLEFQQSICSVMNALNESEDSCSVDDEVVADVCRAASGALDYLVLDSRLSIPPLGEWAIKGGLKGDRNITYLLYRCSDFLSIGVDPEATDNPGEPR